MESFVSPPDLLIYLRASVPTLVSQIQEKVESTRRLYSTRLLKQT